MTQHIYTQGETAMQTLKEAAAEVGIPYRTATQWVAQGLVRVEGNKRKQGSPMPWTDKHTRELRNVATLRRAGVSLQAIRRAADTLSGMGYNPFSSGTFVVIGDPKAEQSVIRVDTNEEAVEVLGKHPGHACLFVPLEAEPKETK